jgi:hypothetical protein
VILNAEKANLLRESKSRLGRLIGANLERSGDGMLVFEIADTPNLGLAAFAKLFFEPPGSHDAVLLEL